MSGGATARPGPGRPPEPRTACGRVARVRMSWKEQVTGTVQTELYADAETPLRLMLAWSKRQCIPPSLTIERRGVKGWAPL